MSASDRRVVFTSEFHWQPPEKKGAVTIVYRAGWSGLVRKACAEAAVSSGAAQKLELKPKETFHEPHR